MNGNAARRTVLVLAVAMAATSACSEVIGEVEDMQSEMIDAIPNPTDQPAAQTNWQWQHAEDMALARARASEQIPAATSECWDASTLAPDSDRYVCLSQCLAVRIAAGGTLGCRAAWRSDERLPPGWPLPGFAQLLDQSANEEGLNG